MTATRPVPLLLLATALTAVPAIAVAIPQDDAEEPAVDETTDEEAAPEEAAASGEPAAEPEIDTAEAEAETEEAPAETAPPTSAETVAEPEQKPKKDARNGDEDRDEDEGDEVLEVGGRLHVGFDTYHKHNESDAWDDTFHIRRARMRIFWRPEEWLDAKLQIDAVGVFEPDFMSMVKDAWVRLKPLDELEIRAGVFKKPFSGLELTSSADLKVIERGVANQFAVAIKDGGLAYGDRDVGLEIGGRLIDSVRLEYAIGVFNGSELAVEDFDNTKDLAARLSMRPVKPLTFGVSSTLRFYDKTFQADGYPLMTVAGEADIALKIDGFRAYIEGLIARQYYRHVHVTPYPSFGDLDTAFGGLAILSYKFKIPSEVKLALEPVVKFEYFDPSDYIIDDHVMLYTVGLNTYVGEYFRVMLDFEIMRAERNWDDDSPDQSQEVADHQERLLLLVCFDI